MPNTLILGLGNPQRADDGAGAAVIRALKEKNFSPYVSLIEGGTPGLEIVLLLQGVERAFIVDAADMGLQPGQWRRLIPDEIELKSSEGSLSWTLHAAGLAEALALAGALQLLPKTVVIYGIQPQSLDWSEGLSEPIAMALPTLCDTLTSEVNGLRTKQPSLS